MTCSTRPARALLAIAALLAAQAARAQEPPLAQLPDSVAERVVAFYNDPTTIRLNGEFRLVEGGEITGNVVALGGPLVVHGRIAGDVVVINGDLELGGSGEITGTATVVGGQLTQGGRVGGATYHYQEPLPFRHDAGGIVHSPEPFESELSAGREFGFGRTDFLIAARGDYNRVEGLPVAFGPRVRIGRSNPTLLEALAIYRSASGLRIDPGQMGYLLRAEQFLGGGQTARLGLTAYSEVTPIERRDLLDRENALSTFVLHEDQRDGYEREGWSAYLRFARAGWPHDLTLEYRNEKDGAVSPASPWSLFDNDEPWRPEPLVGQGTLRTIASHFVYDTRNEVADPATGWHITFDLEQGLGGRLTQPGFEQVGFDQDTLVTPPSGAREKFSAAAIDIRRYARLTPTSRLAMRVLAAGSVDGTPLPSQRQRTLGGEGTLPGYSRFALDCGARRAAVAVNHIAFFPYYGCDRVALFQIEYQAGLPFLERVSLGDLGLEFPVRWIAFFDAGRAWIEPDALSGRERGRSGFSTDAGIGLRVGGLGAYLAVPLSRHGQGVNFFIRLGRRL
ncbi:MAG: BamA/TamA family outer membrane protein [Longimicrobiales bacterium]